MTALTSSEAAIGISGIALLLATYGLLAALQAKHQAREALDEATFQRSSRSTLRRDDVRADR